MVLPLKHSYKTQLPTPPAENQMKINYCSLVVFKQALVGKCNSLFGIHIAFILVKYYKSNSTGLNLYIHVILILI